MKTESPKLKAACQSSRAFTLVELLVAVAVLAILTLFLAQVVSMASQAITANSKRLDSAEQARSFFDRLSMDLAARPRRADLGMLFTKATGNDSLQFYGAVNSYTSPARQVTWVTYQVPTTSTPSLNLPAYQLERGANGTSWTGGTPVQWSGITPASFVSNPPATSPGNNVVLASGIFRLEFSFLINTGVLTNGTSTVTAPTYSNVTALVVGIAVLDSRSLGLISSNPSLIATLSGDFQDTTDGHDPLTDWSTQMATSGFASTLPVPVVQNIHLYQRTFYLP